jgi:hypothetical protein
MILFGVKLTLLLVLLGSVQNVLASDATADEHVVDIRDTPSDFKMPTQLWDKIMEGELKPSEAKKSKDEPEENEGNLIVWLPIQVSLSAKKPQILSHKSIQYNFPRGGGTIDMAKITGGDRGTFHLKFDIHEFTNLAALKVYFISNAKKRRVDNEIFGAGCNVFFDITAAVVASIQGPGIKFNITDNRHISALSGHFVFVQSEKDKVYLSQVEFNDSNNRDYLCKN